MKKINKKEYKELFEKADFKTLFHNPEWHEFLEKEFKWLKFEYYLYKDELLLSFGRIGDKLVSLPFCEYGGPLPLKEKVDFEKFKKEVLDDFKNFKIKFHPKVLTGESDMSTYWIDLKNKSEQELLSSFRKTLRHSIRNAQGKSLEVKKCFDLDELKEFYGLCVANMKRRKTVPYPFSVVKFLYNSPDTELRLAFYKGKIIAGDLFLNYGKFVHYFLGATDYKYLNLGANYFILWEKIRSLLGKDVIFDLGAAPKSSQLETFKRGWRGKEYPILHLGIKRSEESLRSSKLRNIWKLLPNFVIKLISPYFIKYRI